MSEKEDGSSNPPDLEELDQRLREARGDDDRATQNAAARGQAMGMAFRFATELVAGLIVGLAIGWALDTWFETAPIFILIFFFLGMAAGIMNVVRTSQRMQAAQAEANKDLPSVGWDEDE